MTSFDYRRHVVEFYNRTAALYDFGEFVRRDTRRRVVELSDIQSGDRVLDVCTGTGDLAFAFATNGNRVTGADISVGMLKQASKKDPGNRLTWLEMDAAQLPFCDKTFEIATISLALHHMPEPVQLCVLSEIARVTKKHVVIAELNVPRTARWQRVWTAVFKVLDKSECISEWSRQDLASTCMRAGLEVKQRVVTTLGMHRLILCTPGD